MRRRVISHSSGNYHYVGGGRWLARVQSIDRLYECKFTYFRSTLKETLFALLLGRCTPRLGSSLVVALQQMMMMIITAATPSS